MPIPVELPLVVPEAILVGFPLVQEPVDSSKLVGLDVFLFLFQLV